MLSRGLEPDLLVTDVVMPGGSGPELAAALRVRRDDLRVLFISGYAGRSATWPLDTDPRSDSLAKPFDRLQLADKVDGLLHAT